MPLHCSRNQRKIKSKKRKEIKRIEIKIKYKSSSIISHKAYPED